jgi:hypothetical protein
MSEVKLDAAAIADLCAPGHIRYERVGVGRTVFRQVAIHSYR